MKKTLGIILAVAICFGVFAYIKYSAILDDETEITHVESDKVENSVEVSPVFAERDAEESGWKNRTKVYMKDSLVNGRFYIAPLGISLDPTGLPADSAYSYAWSLTDDTARYVEFEAGDFTRSYDYSCLGGIVSIRKDILTDDVDDRYQKMWMAQSAREGKIKDIGEYYVFFQSTDHPCEASYLDESQRSEEIFFDEVKVEKMSQIRENIKKSILSAQPK